MKDKSEKLFDVAFVVVGLVSIIAWLGTIGLILFGLYVAATTDMSSIAKSAGEAVATFKDAAK